MPCRIFIVAVGAAVLVHGYAVRGSAMPQIAEQAPAILVEASAISRTANKGETHGYEVWLNEGDFFEISVSQDQLLAALSAHAPDQSRIHAIDVPDIDPMPQRLMFVAPASGQYAVHVRFVHSERVHVEGPPKPRTRQAAAGGSYLLQVEALRPASAADRERARLFEVLERAVERERLGSMEGLRQAIPLYQEAARGWQAAGEPALEALALEPLAHLAGYFTEHNRDSAIAHERLAELFPQLGERWLEVHNLRTLGTEYLEAGRLEDAKDAVTRARQLSEERGFQHSAASCVHQLAIYEFELGNYDRSRQLAIRGQELAEAVGDRGLQALALWDLSRFDALAGDLDAAIARNTLALELAAGDLTATIRLTMWLGFHHLQRGDFTAAEKYFESRLALAKKTVQRDQEALTRVGLGDVLRARGERDAARQRYEEALSALVRGAQPWRCLAEQRLGRMDLENGDLDRARARFETMRGIAEAIQNAECEAEARAGLADVTARAGDLEAAATQAERVVELMETFREATASSESRALGFGALAPAYERAIDIIMLRAEQGDADALTRALALNERALARGLLDRVLENRLDSRVRAPGELATERNRLRQRWRARLAELQVATRVRPDAPETMKLLDETRGLGVQLRDVDARIDAADSRSAAFLRAQPIDVPVVQALLDEDSLLLEYGLGEARSYLWAVSARDVHAYTLPPRATLETHARRVHEILARPPGERVQAGQMPGGTLDDLRTLSRSLLGPAASLLASKRVILVLPGALSLVPFGALPAPDERGEPLIAGREIVQIPSATTLRAMRELTAGRPRPAGSGVIFADPVFDPKDPRVRRSAAPARPDSVSTPRLGTVSLSRLPFSRDEAREIAALVPASVRMFTGLDATRERAIDAALADHRFIHFATHSIVNQEVPNLSSVVLSLVDSTGRPRDGFLMLPDVYEMTLNADFVVLSGCQTALGRPVRGEGPIGLARAFMYAGVPRVVASLWKVDDLATAELMKRFYRGVIGRGLTPAAALRAAQRELAADPRWRSPYFWAPFVLQGDWR